MNPKKQQFTMKNFSELRPGDKFKAIVIDIQPRQVTLQFENDERLTAKALALPHVRIGDYASFVVKENAKGQIFLEIDKSEGGGKKDDRKFFDMRI